MSESGDYKRTVVFGLDSSEHSQRAFEWYMKNVCDKSKDRVLIIHAQEYPTIPAAPYPYGYAYYEEWQNLVEKSDKEVKALLEDYGRKCRNYGIKFFKLYKEENNKAGEVICKLAEEEKAQLIVMGSRGVGALRRTFLGSVSDYCVHHTTIPVAVVPPPSHHGHHAHTN